MLDDQDIDHEYTKNIVCPYCGSEDSDSWEVSSGEEELGLIECGSCDKHFYARRIIFVEYSTEKAKYGKCNHCEEVNAPIENFVSSIGRYNGLCVKCGDKEKSRLEKIYFKNLGISFGTTESPSHEVTAAEAFGNDCPNGQCS